MEWLNQGKLKACTSFNDKVNDNRKKKKETQESENMFCYWFSDSHLSNKWINKWVEWKVSKWGTSVFPISTVICMVLSQWTLFCIVKNKRSGILLKHELTSCHSSEWHPSLKWEFVLGASSTYDFMIPVPAHFLTFPAFPPLARFAPATVASLTDPHVFQVPSCLSVL